MNVRFPVSKPVLAGREKEYVVDALDSGWISSNGAYIGRFESAVAARLDTDWSLAVCNGTVALHVACLALDLRPGQSVIVPTLTYVATANAVSYCGAKVVLADVSPQDGGLTADSVRAAWRSDTVGVIAVHLYGFPAPVDEITDLCRERGAWLIEDCAESLGASLKGRPTGSFGDAATFSFYGNKTISTGEGGLVTLRDPTLRQRATMLRGQGMDPARRYWHPMIGYNYRMTNVAAAIGLGQVECADYHLSERRRIAARYARVLAPLEADGLAAMPREMPDSRGSFWLSCLVLGRGGPAVRDAVMDRLLSQHGIETRPYFVPMHRLPMYAVDASFPVATRLAEHGMNLPSYSGLSDADIDWIGEQVVAAVRDEAQCLA